VLLELMQTGLKKKKKKKVDGSVAIISIKNFPVSPHVMYLYFPDTLHT
jgi:hypothetical protein